MHPQIARKEPGSCPLCGMALEPMVPTGAEPANPELRDMTRRFWVGVALSVPLLGLVMAADFIAGVGALTASRPGVWIQLVPGSAAVLWCGWPFFQRGWASFRAGRLNMFSLTALGTEIAYAYSVVAALAPQIFPVSFRGPQGEVPLYFEAAAVIVTLVLLGQVLELRALVDQQRHPRPARSGAETRPPAARGRRRRRRSARGGRGGRSPTRPARRKGAGRRRAARRPQRRRRVDDHRRAGTGREEPW
jgi:cation transport ATPase